MISKIEQKDLDLHAAWLRGEDNGVKLVLCAGKIEICADLIDANLRDADLSGADLRGADLRVANLSGADLSRANLSGANLRGANLSGANLRDAYLRGADLSGAYLRGADLSGANLRDADLRGANLSNAYLSGAYLIDANLSGAYLRDADLRGADLSGAYLRGADLSGANLRGADLIGANLIGADLSDADLSGANLSGAKGTEYAIAITSILPDGVLTVYKQANAGDEKVILTLEIPEGAKRSNATGRKCRAEYAILRGIDGLGWEYDGSPVVSDYDNSFVYPAIGEVIRPDNWDDNRWDECSNGIHFFISRLEAEKY